MIETKTIEEIVNKQDKVEDLFIVDIRVKPGNSISVLIDSPSGVNVKECTQISRLIENSFDREIEDFSLQVSSPGLSQALKVFQQYLKNIGRDVEIIKTNEEKYVGKLLQVTNDFVEIEYSEKRKVEGKKKKQIITQILKINFNEIKQTKVIISFK